ncbi:hypothetical protein ACPWT1_11725 [Ramlibacter sp. MMS24-I3-19]|uniref:hypothetical protein n=1 Tax=Ramlibacter sp. MMS24-I3-19 TaxID=3416606 RepID=UPI003D036B2C
MAFGTKRTRVVASAGSSSKDPAGGVASADQVVPSTVYCQLPLLESTAVIAMPRRAPVSSSVIFPATRAETSVPAPAAASSTCAGRLAVPASTGALLGKPPNRATMASPPPAWAGCAPSLVDRPVALPEPTM